MPVSTMADGYSWDSRDARTLFQNSKVIKIDNKTNAILLSATKANLIEKYFKVAFKNAGYSFCTDECSSNSLIFRLNVKKFYSAGTECKQGYSTIAFNYQLYKSDKKTLLLKGKWTQRENMMLSDFAMKAAIKNSGWIR